jgi:hypothetical protein
MDLVSWLNKFTVITEWDGKYPTQLSLHAYPHFMVDIYAAWEKKGPVGAREILKELRRRISDVDYINIKHWVDISYWEYPEGVIPIRVTDSGELNCGYSRRWEEGLFNVFGKVATEITWHIHDGYGEEAGTVEVWAVFVPNKYKL